MSGAELNLLDYGLLGVLILSSVLGLFRGLVREVLSLISWVLAFWLAQRYTGVLSGRLEPFIGTDSLRQLAAFLALFLGSLIALALFNRLLTLLVRASKLGPLDRILGWFFGLARGVVIGVVFIVLTDLTPLADQSDWRGSAVGNYYRELGDWAKEHLPADLRSRVKVPDLGAQDASSMRGLVRDVYLNGFRA
ncbi:MAG: CvpA family protein [Gammaproteobacteria bacterium]|nr:CvpA family protein [Gammaproteobacteria bacterium]